MADINPENIDDEQTGMTDEEVSQEVSQEMNNPEGGGEEIVTYADALDIIGIYEMDINNITNEINVLSRDMAEIEAEIKTIKNGIQYSVEDEWREKKTPTLSNEKLRQIEVDKRVSNSEEIKELNIKVKSYQDVINEHKDKIAVETIYKNNEKRAFDALLAFARAQSEG